MRIIAFVPDLFFRVKIDAALKGNVRFVSSLEDVGDFDFFIAGLEDARAQKFIEAHPRKSVCFYSHVNTEIARRAREMGVKAFPRSSFLEKLPEVVR